MDSLINPWKNYWNISGKTHRRLPGGNSEVISVWISVEILERAPERTTKPNHRIILGGTDEEIVGDISSRISNWIQDGTPWEIPEGAPGRNKTNTYS